MSGRHVAISLAILVGALCIATPAGAQGYPAPPDPAASERQARAALSGTLPGSRDRAVQLLLLARAIDLQGRPAEAEPLVREARTIIAATTPTPTGLAGIADFYLADILFGLDRAADALPLAQHALSGLPPGDTIERSYVSVQLTKILIALEQWDAAKPHAIDAYRIRTGRLGPQTTLTLNALANLARINLGLGRIADADRQFREVLDARRRLGEPELIFDAAVEYGNFLTGQGRQQAAIPILREALSIATTHFAHDKSFAIWPRFELAKAIWRANAPGGDADAEQLLREGLAHADKDDEASARDYAEPLYILARILSDTRRDAEAVPILRRIIAAEEPAQGSTTWFASLLGALAHSLMALGDGQTTAENPHHPEARGLLERQIAILERVKGTTSPDLYLPLSRLAIILRWQRDPLANAAAQRAMSVVPETPSETRVQALFNSADTLDAPEAIARIEAARAMLVSISGERDGFLFTIDLRLAQLTQALGDLDRTETIRRSIVARRIAAGDKRGTAEAQAILAILLVGRHKLDAAEAMARDALRLLTELNEADSIPAGYATGVLADIAHRRGDLAAAETRWRAALAIYEARIPGGYARMIAATLTSLGGILIERDRAAEAVPLLARAAAIHLRWFGPESSDVGYAGIVSARALAAARRVDEAKAAFATNYALLARNVARTPGSPQLIEPSRDYARFALLDLHNPALARTLLRSTQPLIVERAARASVDRDAALELTTNRSSLTLAVRANWALANPPR